VCCKRSKNVAFSAKGGGGGSLSVETTAASRRGRMTVSERVVCLQDGRLGCEYVD
jgi:hypothetical protein